MGLIENDVFVCFDCETTGLDTENDKIIEIGAATFQGGTILKSCEDLINPGIAIPINTIEIHHITNEMVLNKPKIDSVINHYLEFIGKHIIVGHGVTFDISILNSEAKRLNINTQLEKLKYVDTLRLARLYGESPSNSLQSLRKHFNIQSNGAHRALSDVHVNIEVFKFLSRQ